MLQRKRIAVTGAFGALGATVMRALAGAGANVAGIARAPVGKAPPQLGGFALFGGADISDARVAEATLGRGCTEARRTRRAGEHRRRVPVGQGQTTAQISGS